MKWLSGVYLQFLVCSCGPQFSRICSGTVLVVSFCSLQLGFIPTLLSFPPPGVHITEGVTLLCNACVTDVIGVCKSVDEATRLTTKSNREVSKRTLHLIDMSGKLVTVTLWGEEVREAHHKGVCCCFKHPDEDGDYISWQDE